MSNSPVGVGPLTALETLGKYGLFRDSNNYAWIGLNGRKRVFPVIGRYPYSQNKIRSGLWRLVGAEVKGTERKIVEQNSKNNNLRVTNLDSQFKADSIPIIYKNNSPRFDEVEKIFKMNFPGNEESYIPSNLFWLQNITDLWGFTQKDDKGAGLVEAFENFNFPTQDLRRNSGQNIVAVIDSGVRRTHEDLKKNMWVNKGEIYGDGIDNDDNGVTDDRYGVAFFDLKDGESVQTGNLDFIADTRVGHGTHVAGTVGAVANKVGVIGANPGVKLMPINISSPYTGEVIESAVFKGIYYAGTNGSKVINMSLKTGYNPYMEKLMEAVADEFDVLYVVAAANDGIDNDTSPRAAFPASYDLDSIISVAASDRFGQRASFSNYGKTTVDLFAPGADINSTSNLNDSSYKEDSGTSMAAPLVAGTVSSYWARNTDLTPQEVKYDLLSSVTKADAYKDTVTGGIINADKLFSSNPTERNLVFEDNSGQQPNRKAVRIWENKFEIEADELTQFKASRITDTVFGLLSEDWTTNNKRKQIEKKSENDKGIFKHIENVEIFETLNNFELIIFDFDNSSGLSDKQTLRQLFGKGIIDSVGLDTLNPVID